MSCGGSNRFYPSWGRARLEAMVNNRPDWCISRQRNWGVPMALFVNKETHELHPRTEELLEQVAQRVEQEGIEAWFSLDAAEFWETKRKITRSLRTRWMYGSIRVPRMIRF